MSAVREFMTTDARCIKETQSLADAARMMMDLDCGSLPICGDDGKLKGMITDRDIALKCVAVGRDPREMMARDLATGSPHWIDADANVDAAIEMMEKYQVRRLPVIADHKLVGIISQGDIARNYSEERVGELVEHISERGRLSRAVPKVKQLSANKRRGELSVALLSDVAGRRRSRKSRRVRRLLLFVEPTHHAASSSALLSVSCRPSACWAARSSCSTTVETPAALSSWCSAKWTPGVVRRCHSASSRNTCPMERCASRRSPNREYLPDGLCRWVITSASWRASCCRRPDARTVSSALSSALIAVPASRSPFVATVYEASAGCGIPVGLEKLPDRADAATDPDVEAAGQSAGPPECGDGVGVNEWNVVPPSISSIGRGWCVRTTDRGLEDRVIAPWLLPAA